MIIPVDAHLITLCLTVFDTVAKPIEAGRTTQTMKIRVPRIREIATRRTEAGLKRDFVPVNHIWAPAGIQFQLRSCRVDRVQIPGDSELVDDNAFGYLAGKLPSSGGAVSLLLVSRFSSEDLGGSADDSKAVCILGDDATAIYIAHEFGHLLTLLDDGNAQYLMNGGFTVANPILSKLEIGKAQKSPLAVRFAGKQ